MYLLVAYSVIHLEVYHIEQRCDLPESPGNSSHHIFYRADVVLTEHHYQHQFTGTCGAHHQRAHQPLLSLQVVEAIALLQGITADKQAQFV